MAVLERQSKAMQTWSAVSVSRAMLYKRKNAVMTSVEALLSIHLIFQVDRYTMIIIGSRPSPISVSPIAFEPSEGQAQ